MIYFFLAGFVLLSLYLIGLSLFFHLMEFLQKLDNAVEAEHLKQLQLYDLQQQGHQK